MDHLTTNTLEWSPDQARIACRTDRSMEKYSTSSNFCMGYIQTNIAIVPSEVADDLAEFCRLNSVFCPLLYQSKPGEVSAGSFARTSDIRTDLNRYLINKKTKDGRQETTSAWQLVDHPWEDMVTFYTGCSYSFQDALIKAGVLIQNIKDGVDCSIFDTNIQCASAGRMSCPGMAVSMRPIQKDLLQTTVTITAKYDAVHGAPIHIGDPSMIGIKDILNPEWGDPAHFDNDQLVPVFWGCGHTSAEAVRHANLDISFSHSVPGILFITDVLADDYFKDHPPLHGDEQPVVITLNDDPYYASILGQTTFNSIQQIESIIQDDLTGYDSEGFQMSGELVKSSLRISHARSVAIVTGLPEDRGVDSEEIVAALVVVRALQALDKNLTLLVSDGDGPLMTGLVDKCMKCEVFTKQVTVQELSKYKEQGQERFDVVIHVGEGGGLQGKYSTINISSKTSHLNRTSNGTNHVTQQNSIIAHSSSGANHVVQVGIPIYGGVAVAMSVLLLHNCLIHSRYRRHGVGEHHPVDMLIMTDIVKQIDKVLGILASHNLDKSSKIIARKYQHKLDQILSTIAQTS